MSVFYLTLPSIPDMLVAIRVLVIAIARFERWTWSTRFSFDPAGKHDVSMLGKGSFVNYVSTFLPIFDQVSTLSKHVY